MAAHFQPDAVHGRREGDIDRDKPGYFVCNVGHIDNTHPGGAPSTLPLWWQCVWMEGSNLHMLNVSAVKQTSFAIVAALALFATSTTKAATYLLRRLCNSPPAVMNRAKGADCSISLQPFWKYALQ
eukprot:1172143-Amphidinium_carterae.1